MASELSSQDVLPTTTTCELIAELKATGSHTTSDAGSEIPGHSHSKSRYVTGDAAVCKQSQQSKMQGHTTQIDNIIPGVSAISSCIGLMSDTKIGNESNCVDMLKEQATKDSASSATGVGRRTLHMPRTLSTTKSEASSAADPTNLIVNYIPASVNETEFKSMFDPFGEISSYRLIYDRLTGRHIGYGFVKFSEASSAEKAILKYDGFPLKNKLLKVSYARPSGGSKRCNVYISGMPVFYTEEQLADLFSPFGSVEDSKILRNEKGESRGVGFARLSTVEAAEKAIESLHNTVPALGSSRISVKYADRGERRSLARGSNRSTFGSRQSLSPNSSTAYESLLYGGGSYFNFGYGPETASMYGYNPQGTPANYSNPQATYTPIHPERFSSLSSVYPASPQNFRSIADAGPSYTSQTNVASQTVTDVPTSPLGSPGGQYAGVCLFCFHLPYELDEPGLQGMFEPYGTVVHVKVMRDLASGQSKGYGFVNMQTFQQALTAISALNGYPLGGKHLKVEFKKPSERRRTTSKISQQEQLKEMKQHQMYTS